MTETDHNEQKPNPKRAARAYVHEGKSLKDAFIEAGYSPAQARKGLGLLAERPGIAKAFGEERKKQINKLVALGSSVTPEEQEKLARGTLVDEALQQGSKQRVRAAELLGKDRRVNMFEPETSLNVLQYVNAMPADFEWEPASPKDAHEPANPLGTFLLGSTN